MVVDGVIYQKRQYPSPNPHIQLTEITYGSGGFKVKGLLAEPMSKSQYEGIVYLRGGMQHVGMVRPARIAQFAAHGFIVFAPYYRGNRGGEGRDEFAGADRLDAVNAVDVLKQHPQIKKDRIHLYAFSRGGMMALWTAILRNDVTSLVAWAGVSDVVHTYQERMDMRRMMKRVIGGTPNSLATAYRERTALFRLDELMTPVLLIHGKQDEHVSFTQALLLEHELRGMQKEVETWYFLNFGHYFPPYQNRRVVQDLCKWMKAQPTIVC